MKFEHTERKLSLYKTRRKNSFMWLPIDEMAYRISRREKNLESSQTCFLSKFEKDTSRRCDFRRLKKFTKRVWEFCMNL